MLLDFLSSVNNLQQVHLGSSARWRSMWRVPGTAERNRHRLRAGIATDYGSCVSKVLTRLCLPTDAPL